MNNAPFKIPGIRDCDYIRLIIIPKFIFYIEQIKIASMAHGTLTAVHGLLIQTRTGALINTFQYGSYLPLRPILQIPIGKRSVLDTQIRKINRIQPLYFFLRHVR